MKKCCAFLLAAVLLVTSVSVTGTVQVAAAGNAEVTVSDLKSYTEYNSENSANDATDDVTVTGQNYKTSGGKVTKAMYNGKDAARLEGEGSSVTYEVNVPKTAKYSIMVNYCAIKGRNKPISMDLKIDGKNPFSGTDTFELSRTFKDATDVRTDGLGNEFSAEQVEAFIYNNAYIKDSLGEESMPYTFYLTKGKHNITFTVIEEQVAFASVTVGKPLKYKSYEEVSADYPEEKTGKAIKVEGESAAYKSTYSLIGKADSSDPRMSSKTPQSAYLSRINYIGNTNWQEPGDTITWKINVEEAGLYKLGFRFRQNFVLNGNSYRKIYIDGKVPFEEAASVKFGYKVNWQYDEWKDDNGNPYYVYLTAGEHTLAMEVCLGNLTDVVRRLETVLYGVGTLYRKIVMITGDTVDANRDYDLFNQIPQFEEKLTEYKEELESIADEIDKISADGNKRSEGNSNSTTIRALTTIMGKMLQYPYLAHTYKSSYYSNYTACSALVYDIMKMGLSIDYIDILPADQAYEPNIAGFFEKAGFSIQRFLSSFSENYDNISGDVETKDSITIWVNWGRDQVRILNDLIESSFTKKTGIGVNLKISNASYIQGILSGNGPDCSLNMQRSEPVNLALRGSMYDLKNFPDYEEVLKRFMSTDNVTPYQFNGGTYALPDTITYYMMFYRTDIFEEHKLSVPKTWDEYIETSSYLMRNNLQASLPYIQLTAITQVNSGVGSFSIFPSLLLQKGQKLYTEDLSATDLTNATALEMFEFWTDFYNEYKFPVTADFFNRFRTGVMPLGIQTYTQYIQLSLAAPEISGKWAMAPIPGFKDENGNINNVQAGAGTGCGILNISKNKKGGWEFMKWWLSADTQLNYSNNCESILGVSGRVATTNVEAFKQMGWDAESLKALLSQWSKVKEIEEVPGGYYTARCIDQAYWNVVNNGKNGKDTMVKWSQIANNEITRKRKQYNVQ